MFYYTHVQFIYHQVIHLTHCSIHIHSEHISFTDMYKHFFVIKSSTHKSLSLHALFEQIFPKFHDYHN